MTNRKKRIKIKKIAKERIEKLFCEAKNIYKFNPSLAERYIKLIKELRKKYHPRVPRNIKMFICKKCNSVLIPGYNARVRLRTNKFPHITITCLKCGNIKRIPYKLRK